MLHHIPGDLGVSLRIGAFEPQGVDHFDAGCFGERKQVVNIRFAGDGDGFALSGIASHAQALDA